MIRRRLRCLLLTVAFAGFATFPALPAFAQGEPRAASPGQSCAAGEFGMAQALLVCESGVFRFALPADVPPAPEGGYTSRPAWYPTLASTMGRPATACGPLGRVMFTHPVINPDDVVSIIPQGMMIADHVTPIDHGYLGGRSLSKPVAARTAADWLPVTAPADGTILQLAMLGSPTSLRVVIEHACETYSIYMVLNRVSGILAPYHDDLLAKQYLTLNLPITAGTIFGEQRDNPLDFSVHVGSAWLRGFVAPFSYSMLESWKPFTVDPWPYFASDLGTAYHGRMQRTSEPRWGVIDQDIAGAAAGNWFLKDTFGYSGQPVAAFQQANAPSFGWVEGKRTYAWSHLAIARHWVQPSRWVFSVGWWSDPAGDPRQSLIEIPAGTPEPSALTAASGTVVYRLTQWSNIGQSPDSENLPIGYQLGPGATLGIVAMRVNADGTLSVEVQPGVTDLGAFRGFSAAVRTYWR